ncbi:hypothetical protein ILYODFUR_034142 [Ilyodon furcidens]|uniref:Uncharacterized protein n=1 Tax=Ilyodon furcidens TaxID=33524 RepID=A0ABV0T4W0_9TELE
MLGVKAFLPKAQYPGTQDDSMEPPEATQKKARKSLASFFKTSPAPASMVTCFVEAELNSHLVSPTIDAEENPLLWWQLH